MFRTLIRKEIVETILDLRFTIVMLLCIVLIPLGMYVSRKDYEQRFADYQRAKQTYQQHYGKRVGGYIEAEGYRPPSVLSVFALGLEYFIPDKAVTSRDGIVRTSKESGIRNPQSLLLGKSDLLFNVSFILSLAALIFTFNCISGEKGMGTLRMTISNPIPRAQILLAKIVGSYVTILIPFVISILIALIILDASPDISILSSQLWPTFLVILAVTLLFILAMITLGICISALTYSSITSIVVSLFVWMLVVLAFPKISPMIAEVVYPTESPSVVSLRKQIAKEQIELELNKRKTELFKECLTAAGASLPKVPKMHPETDAEKMAYAEYDDKAYTLDKEYQRRIANEMLKISQNYKNKQNMQASIAMNFSRISPISCYTYLVSGLSGTGVTEPDNFMENAQRFQEEVKKAVYDNYIHKIYIVAGFATGGDVPVEGFDAAAVSVPKMHYRYPSLAEALEAGWIDILLLFVFNFLFFIVAFLKFRKYDVR